MLIYQYLIKVHVVLNFEEAVSALFITTKQTWAVLLFSKTCVKRPLSKRPKNGFQYQLSLNAGQTYCRMLQKEHSVIRLTFIKLPFVIKIFVLLIFEWPFKTGLTVFYFSRLPCKIGEPLESLYYIFCCRNQDNASNVFEEVAITHKSIVIWF